MPSRAGTALSPGSPQPLPSPPLEPPLEPDAHPEALPDAPPSRQTTAENGKANGTLASTVKEDDASATAAAENPGFAAATLDELRRVVWPSRQQLFSESVAVILMVSLSAAAIAAIDRFYGWASTQVFR